MKVCLAALAVATFTWGLATAAAAASPVTAQLQAPVEGRVKQVAGGTVFVCEKDACTAGTPASSTLTVAACRELARAVGAVATYGSQTKQLDPEKLSACNAWSNAKTGTTSEASRAQ